MLYRFPSRESILYASTEMVVRFLGDCGSGFGSTYRTYESIGRTKFLIFDCLDLNF